MRQITSSTLGNQDISSALLCHTYTADADRSIFFRVFADQVAGDGDYVAYVAVQRLGAGSFYRVVPKTTAAVAAGVTAIGLTTIALPVKNTDVVRVYLTGLVADTATPDIVTEVWEDDAVLNSVWTDAKAAFVDSAISGVKTDTAAILVDTDVIGAAGAGLTALGDTRLANLDATVSSRGTADPGDAMTLEVDSIKKVTFDETTAWPLLAADTGATQVARVGADSDTLETLSDQIDGAAVPGSEMLLTAAYDAAKTAAQEGDAMILSAAYDLAKTAAQAGDGMALTAAAVDDILDEVVEETLTMRQMLRVLLAFVAGRTEGGNTANPVFKSQDGLKDRVDMTVDADGDRSSVTVDGS